MERSALSKYNLPDCPGVYLFKEGRRVLYVGKATSLRDRVRSYFDDDLIAMRGPRIVDMVTKANALSYETTPTVLEALVKESALIRKYRPYANVEGKDDKTFLYAIITDETIPRVLAIRGKDISRNQSKKSVRSGALAQVSSTFFALVAPNQKIKVRQIFGPFPSGYQLREGLRLIRKIFPFYDTPRPVGDASKHQRAKIEFNKQIGQYPKDIDRASYLKNIRHVALFLSGRTRELRKLLAKEMKKAAADERFEDAAEARRQLFALDHIQDVSLIRDEYRDRLREEQDVQGQRIEAYDTAHISGTNAIGVMTVVIGGMVSKRDYRTFRIRGFKKNDDIASLKELLTRRLGHPEWQLPRAVVVDGGKTHKKAAEEVLKTVGVLIPVVAVVKDERHRPREVIGAIRAGISEADVVLANSEAHRFALRLHRKARGKTHRM